MSRIVTWCIGLALVGALAGCGQSAVVRGVSSQRRAIEVPGLAALNRGRNESIPVGVSSVSCASAGNCAAGGSYQDGGGRQQGFVVSETNGGWGQAIEVPGLAALNKGGSAGVSSVSCASAGNCAAGGGYGGGQGFVVSETNGTWGQAIQVPGLAALSERESAGVPAGVSSVSCASAGNCAAGGSYQDGGGRQQGFVVSETNGAWGQAIEVPGLAALNAGGNAGVGSVSCASGGNCAAGAVSCASAGNCAAGGSYQDSSGRQRGFVVSERNGAWGQAIEVPGLAALSKGGSADVPVGVSSLSCASAGNCAAGGDYADGGGRQQGFVVSETNGAWDRAIQVPGLRALGQNARVSSLSCASPGNCAAGGDYGWDSGSPYPWGFVVSEKNGAWGRAINVPGLGALNNGRYADVNSVSCAPQGNCAAGGDYEDMPNGSQGFVVSEKNGAWGRAINVPGLGALNKGGGAEVSSVSCAPQGSCTAGGFYTVRIRGRQLLQGFVF